jgi:hypothetical protein
MAKEMKTAHELQAMIALQVMDRPILSLDVRRLPEGGWQAVAVGPPDSIAKTQAILDVITTDMNLAYGLID